MFDKYIIKNYNDKYIIHKEGNMNFKEFGQNISKLRKEQKIPQDELCKNIGISRATLSSFENGRGVDIGFKKVMYIVRYLGYEINLKRSSPFPTFEELRDAQ